MYYRKIENSRDFAKVSSVNRRHEKQKTVSGFKVENGLDVLRFSCIYNALAIETNQRFFIILLLGSFYKGQMLAEKMCESIRLAQVQKNYNTSLFFLKTQ